MKEDPSFEPLVLDNNMNDFLEIMENSDQHLFITGKAGTGKSTLLQLFTDTTKKNVVALAPTGIAALHIGGQTIHSFFGFPGRMVTDKDIRKTGNSGLLKKIDSLIIDEISMVRCDVLDAIDKTLRVNRGSDAAFGGVQLILFGDLFQLPPVVSSDEEKWYFTTHYQGPYFFNAKVFQSGIIINHYELKIVYRQEERGFIRLLDSIRKAQVDWDDLEEINERVAVHEEHEDLIILAGRNASVDTINKESLEKLSGKTERYSGSFTGNFDVKRCPAEVQLELKTGAKVMFIKNDPLKKYVNGTLGLITSLEKDKVKVKILDHNHNETEIEVSQVTWEMHKYKINKDNPKKVEVETIGTFSQYPLRLAWALTIHKSQGKTFDHVMIDNAMGMFAYGQLYVALSRCRTLGGIYLKKSVQQRDIMVDPAVIEYYTTHFS
ncbi:MAG TPA: DEAD/DEAH box helicase [Saprospiraceae bacterium]|nr:DEAD/DEAH box helicase [Saprospiraceae bacterium]